MVWSRKCVFELNIRNIRVVKCETDFFFLENFQSLEMPNDVLNS